MVYKSRAAEEGITAPVFTPFGFTMSALTYAFWSLPTYSYWLDIQSESPGSLVVADLVKCILLSMSTGQSKILISNALFEH